MASLIHLRSGRTVSLQCAACGSDSALAPLFSDEWLGTDVWPAARVLIAYLDEQQAALRLPSLSIVELGSGTGACGLAAAALGATRVLLTDKGALLPTLEHNIKLNSVGGSVGCRELAWSTAALPRDVLPDGADLVLMSDCLNVVYGDQHAAALASTLRCILQRRLQAEAVCCPPAPLALLSQARRGSGKAEAAFFAECERIGLATQLISTSLLPASAAASDSIGFQASHADAGEGAAIEVSLYVLKVAAVHASCLEVGIELSWHKV
jgi:hypothetical protein